MTLRVIYDPDKNLAVSDGAAPGVAKALVNEHNRGYTLLVYNATYSTWNVLDELRLLKCRGEVNGELIFVYKDEDIPVNDDGTLNRWPIGIDRHLDFLEALFDAQAERLARG